MNDRKTEEYGKKRLIELSNGIIVEEDVLGIVKRIQQYDPNLTIQYCDPDKSEVYDAPYRIMEQCPDGIQRMVMEVWELDERVIQRLFASDTQRHNVLEGVDNRNAMVMAGIRQRYRDENAALSELVRDILNTPKDTYKATNPVTGEKHTFRATKQSPR